MNRKQKTYALMKIEFIKMSILWITIAELCTFGIVDRSRFSFSNFIENGREEKNKKIIMKIYIPMKAHWAHFQLQ